MPKKKKVIEDLAQEEITEMKFQEEMTEYFPVSDNFTMNVIVEKKETYKVILVAKNYIVIERNGTNQWLAIKAAYTNVKIGDFVQIE